MLVARGAHNHYQIATFCEEPQLAYDRVHLSEYFSGRSAEDLSLVAADFYKDNHITVYQGERADTIDRQRQIVISQQGREIPYDKLVLATGSFPFVPPIPGRDRSHCLVYRTLNDLDKIAIAAKDSRVGTVIGGGLLGLECANALKELGLEPHVVEFAPRLMAVQMDDGGALMLQRKIEKLGVQVHLSKNTREIGAGETCRHRLNFADDESLETDLVVFSAGIRPRDELAHHCELEIGPRGGVVIDNYCRTSDTNIYAIGECALWNGQIFGLVAPGYQMAQVAVDHLLEDATSAAFTGADMSTKLKLLGVDVASIGDGHGRTPGSRAYCFSDEAQEIYKKIVVSENGKHLLGAVLVGDTDAYGNLLQLALNGIKLPPHPDTLILPQRDGATSPALGVDVLPDSAQICSCNNVSKGHLHAAIEGGVMALGDLKSCTKASTSCGGCAPLVKQVLDAELKRRGIAVNNHLCEHFPYSRQELYHLVRVESIKSFKALLDSHGQGRGCDICKPAVASILASCWNEYVLKNEHTGLQDTNDRFLGNLQKDGTYSIVPRIPGGEISPDKLIVLGQVAKNYGLYTKITGGQRIDMFGAQVHQLPDIWRELVDAGFESGHAYAKALRTVKSCVGTSWCRYGVQDSVSMAIQVENRYRGLRSPHKIKMAVSGCTRECAEAQSKDVGVIATEKGWNLYVCGNGGMKPRHADLFAIDLDDATLIRTIDRFLMFYIKTAERLQRTSTWLNNLEGGLDYLREVIIDDTLGIGAELEQQMAQVVDTFQCEWKTTIEDPEKLKRFSHFVNSDKPDNRVVFVHERGQIRPAKPEEKVIRFREVV
jgi:nitrite reductase (NADH) large subunit